MIKKMNEIVNQKKFKSTDIKSLKGEVIHVLEKNFGEVLRSYYDEFYIKRDAVLKTNLHDFKVQMDFIFKIKVKRITKNHKYIYHIDTNPIILDYVNVYVEIPSFKIEPKTGLISSTEFHHFENIKLKKVKDVDVDEVISLIDRNEIIEEYKLSLIQPFLKKVLFHDRGNLDEFVKKDGKFDDEKIYEYILEKNMLKI